MSVCLNELNIDDSIFCTPLSLSLFLLQTYLSLDVISFALWCFLFNLNFYCIFIFALLILNWKFYKALSSFFFCLVLKLWKRCCLSQSEATLVSGDGDGLKMFI